MSWPVSQRMTRRVPAKSVGPAHEATGAESGVGVDDPYRVDRAAASGARPLRRLRTIFTICRGPTVPSARPRACDGLHPQPCVMHPDTCGRPYAEQNGRSGTIRSIVLAKTAAAEGQRARQPRVTFAWHAATARSARDLHGRREPTSVSTATEPGSPPVTPDQQVAPPFDPPGNSSLR